jgi:hypothetical protein
MKENNSVLLTNKIKHLILFKFNIFYRFLKPKKALQLQKKKKKIIIIIKKNSMLISFIYNTSDFSYVM